MSPESISLRCLIPKLLVLYGWDFLRFNVFVNDSRKRLKLKFGKHYVGRTFKIRQCLFCCLVWGLIFQFSWQMFAAEPVKNKPKENPRPEIPAGPGPIVSRPALVPDAKPTPDP